MNSDVLSSKLRLRAGRYPQGPVKIGKRPALCPYPVAHKIHLSRRSTTNQPDRQNRTLSNRLTSATSQTGAVSSLNNTALFDPLAESLIFTNHWRRPSSAGSPACPC